VHTLTGQYSAAIPSHGGLSTALPHPDSCVINPTYNHQNDVRNFPESYNHQKDNNNFQESESVHEPA